MPPWWCSSPVSWCPWQSRLACKCWCNGVSKTQPVSDQDGQLCTQCHGCCNTAAPVRTIEQSDSDRSLLPAAGVSCNPLFAGMVYVCMLYMSCKAPARCSRTWSTYLVLQGWESALATKPERSVQAPPTKSFASADRRRLRMQVPTAHNNL